MRFTIKLKLGLAFGGLILLIGASGIYAIDSLGDSNQHMREFSDGPFAQVQRVDQLESMSLNAARLLGHAMAVPTDAERLAVQSEFHTNEENFRTVFDAYVAKMAASKRPYADPLRTSWNALVDAADKALSEAVKNGNNHASEQAESSAAIATRLVKDLAALAARPSLPEEVSRLTGEMKVAVIAAQRDAYGAIVVTDDTSLKQVSEDFESNTRTATDALAALVAAHADGAAELQADWTAFEKEARGAETLGIANSDAHALAIYSGPFTEARTTLAAEVRKLRDGEAATAQDFVNETQASYEATRTTLIIIVLAALALGAGTALWMALSISRGLARAVDVARNVARGDLTREITVSARDEIGDLERAMRDMASKLVDIVGQVMTAAENVTAGSSELSASAEQLSEGSTEQAASTEEASASVEEMASNVKQNAENASQTERIAEQSARDAEKSGVAVARAVEAMQTIAGKINIVQEIARQTDLLALNAAVEAARAGEHGKGFAVVASEVRKLAERSQAAAAEIGTLSTDTLKVAQDAGTMLDRLVPDIKRTAKLVQEISTACREQDVGTAQINQAIQQLDKVTQQNAASSEEVSATSEELAAQAEQLQSTIAYFRTDAAPGQTAAAPAKPFDRAPRQPRRPAPSIVPATSAAIRPRPKRLVAARTGAQPAGGFSFDLNDNGSPDERDAGFQRA